MVATKIRRDRLRAADDFATIRARMLELRRERERAQAPEGGLPRDPPIPPVRSDRRPPLEIGEGTGTGPPIWHDTQLGREEDC